MAFLLIQLCLIPSVYKFMKTTSYFMEGATVWHRLIERGSYDEIRDIYTSTLELRQRNVLLRELVGGFGAHLEIAELIIEFSPDLIRRRSIVSNYRYIIGELCEDDVYDICTYCLSTVRFGEMFSCLCDELKLHELRLDVLTKKELLRIQQSRD
eukprot:TRINITY_DN2437_c0_g1_i1.p1 TRINITY_DN2437_c0_g1~~TRINITY_DN2437_c0_g1_i1.p1  ORF type:complete len:154 (-),score=15.88 TRINITY_DN2437_c0_g1_i1:224-685(-)